MQVVLQNPYQFLCHGKKLHTEEPFKNTINPIKPQKIEQLSCDL